MAGDARNRGGKLSVSDDYRAGGMQAAGEDIDAKGLARRIGIREQQRRREQGQQGKPLGSTCQAPLQGSK